mmetsp:Transcript_23235/g.20116  ORF Transcript_23235/g.20116 Transcript_23235/m.20116 type:complete len:131 (+) Transcript_23235:823-1215(+)
MTGLSAINFYSTKIMLGSSASKNPTPDQVDDARYINLGMGVLRLCTALSAGMLLDKFGRRKLYLVGNVFVIISMALLGLGVDDSIENLARPMVLLFALGTSLGYALVNPLYLCECLPFKAVSYMVFMDHS